MLTCTPNIGQDDLYEYTHRVRRTILEVLQDFRHVSIPLDYIFDVFPLIRPRQFSIASSSRHARSKPLVPSSGTKHVNGEREAHLSVEMDLCVAIVSYKTRLKIPRRGLCTTWLASLEPSSKDSDGLLTTPTTLRIGIRKGAMRLPEPKEDAKAVPVICVGPGTGVAPMRAIIQERIARGEHGTQAYTSN
jgi:sulfite reductase alpha subunit-like flavoprotein